MNPYHIDMKYVKGDMWKLRRQYQTGIVPFFLCVDSIAGLEDHDDEDGSGCTVVLALAIGG